MDTGNMSTATHLIALLAWPPDHSMLIGASFALALIALALIAALWADRRIYARYPKLLSLAVWCMIAAVTAMIVAEAAP